VDQSERHPRAAVPLFDPAQSATKARRYGGSDRVAMNRLLLDLYPNGFPSVRAFAFKKDTDLTAATVREQCAKRPMGYKLAKSAEFQERLPKTPISKISRHRLREAAASCHG